MGLEPVDHLVHAVEVVASKPEAFSGDGKVFMDCSSELIRDNELAGVLFGGSEDVGESRGILLTLDADIVFNLIFVLFEDQVLQGIFVAKYFSSILSHWSYKTGQDFIQVFV